MENTEGTPVVQSGEEIIDIFNWANQTDAIKNTVQVEFFLFNKNYTPYFLNLDESLANQIRPLFLFDMINFVNLGAGTGLQVRDYEMSEKEDNVLLRSRLEKVGRAETLIHLIEHERSDISIFSEQEHEFKRIKGIIARFSDLKNPDFQTFYAVKMVQAGQSVKGATAWEFSDGKFSPMNADFAWKVPEDNQVLIVGKDIFAFNVGKFERLFNYEYKKQLLADKKADEILGKYKLSFPDGMDLQSLVRDTKSVVNKLQKLEVGEISQEQAIDYADEMQLDLMTDDNGAIIIMDSRDLGTFVNLINEDYITSQITGKRYVITGKKPLDEPEGEPPRG